MQRGREHDGLSQGVVDRSIRLDSETSKFYGDYGICTIGIS